MLGIGLLFLSLVCDGLLPDVQAQIKTQMKPTPMQMFEHINKWKTIISIIYCVSTWEI